MADPARPLFLRSVVEADTFCLLCPQGSRAASPHQECEYLQMIEIQRQQCLEEAQLENETTGEMSASGGVPSPHRSQAQSKAYGSHNSQLDGDRGHRSYARALGPRHSRKATRPPHLPDPIHIWGIPSSYLGKVFKGPAMAAGLLGYPRRETEASDSKGFS